MNRRFVLFAAIVAGVLVALTVSNIRYSPWTNTVARTVDQRGPLSEAERANIELFERVSPSVVQVAARSAAANPLAEDEGGEAAAGAASGTGFVWDNAGHVVTDNHVVQNGSEVAVRFASGEVAQAEIIGVAPNYDLAVLRIKNARQLPPPVALGSSTELKVGQSAFAIGNPFGLDQSLTSGIISALKRRLPTSSGREIANVIQTDTAINPGNSGGPLLDSAGRLIGVNTAIISPSGSSAGIGFSIPVDIVNRIIPQLIRQGEITRAGLGVRVGDDRVSRRLNLPGVLIIEVEKGSAAEAAGLRSTRVDAKGEVKLGDVIVAIDGGSIETSIE